MVAPEHAKKALFWSRPFRFVYSRPSTKNKNRHVHSQKEEIENELESYQEQFFMSECFLSEKCSFRCSKSSEQSSWKFFGGTFSIRLFKIQLSNFDSNLIDSNLSIEKHWEALRIGFTENVKALKVIARIECINVDLLFDVHRCVAHLWSTCLHKPPPIHNQCHRCWFNTTGRVSNSNFTQINPRHDWNHSARPKRFFRGSLLSLRCRLL